MLTQDMLNVSKRNKMNVDILMFTKDDNISVSNITANSENQYAKTSSIVVLDKYAPQPMATLENNEYLLDGLFFNPAVGARYDTYMSDVMSDDNGNFSTNPLITMTLVNTSKIENISIILNSYIETSYPKSLIVRLFDTNNNNLSTKTINYSEMTDKPNVIFSFNGVEGVKKVTVEYVGTQFPHRRARLTQIMFGKLYVFNRDLLSSIDYDNRTSYVADSIPSKTLKFDLINFSKIYNIDNPNNALPDLTQHTEVTLHWIYDNLENGTLEYSPMEHFKLTNISTNKEDIATFECNSILDTLTVEFDRDVYTGIRTVNSISNSLLNFCGLPANTVIFDGDYGNAEIDRPIQTAPVREIYQKLAFAIGATIIIQDDGRIRFANLSLEEAPICKISYSNFLSVPAAEELKHTKDLTIVRYMSEVDEESSSLSKNSFNTINNRITYNPAISPYIYNIENGSVTDVRFYTEHADITVDFENDYDDVNVEIYGRKITVKSTIDRTATDNTLRLDSGLCYKVTDEMKEKYKNWYKQKFKYTAKTRGEPLIRAGKMITIQSPFTEDLLCYVLANNIKFDGALSGDIEVIAIGKEA